MTTPIYRFDTSSNRVGFKLGNIPTVGHSKLNSETRMIGLRLGEEGGAALHDQLLQVVGNAKESGDVDAKAQHYLPLNDEGILWLRWSEKLKQQPIFIDADRVEFDEAPEIEGGSIVSVVGSLALNGYESANGPVVTFNCYVKGLQVVSAADRLDSLLADLDSIA